jgi:hypothetical protein
MPGVQNTRLPSRLAQLHPGLSALQREDSFGCLERLRAIELVLGGRQLGEAIDLGGNSGFFCLSLIHAGMMTKATVYDLSLNALSAGQTLARQLGIADKIAFVEQAIDLDFIRSLPSVDTILCLNLLHHAGSKFDVTQVNRAGWGRYAELWLDTMRRKCQQAIISIDLAPLGNWDAPHQMRPVRFAQLAEGVGWSVLYHANVGDIQASGVERANRADLVLSPPVQSALAHRARRIVKLTNFKRQWNFLKRSVGAKNNRSKRGEFHLYILQPVNDTSFSRVRHLVVVAGPSGAGKTTFINHLTTEQLPKEIAERFPPTEKWVHVEDRDVREHGFSFLTLAAKRERVEIPDVVLHYKLTKTIYHDDPALNVLKIAKTITVVTLRPRVERLISQLIHRDFRSRSKRKLHCYQESGWLDDLYRDWQSYLQSLEAERGNIKQIFLEPDSAAQIGAIFRWRKSDLRST